MTGHEHDGNDRQRDDALRAGLAGLDPTRPGGPVFAADPTPDHVEELIMATTEQPTTTEDQRGHKDGARWRRTGRTRWLAVATALVLVAAGITGVLTLRGGDVPTTEQPRIVALSVPGGDGTMTSSCIQFDVQFLREMPLAFAGTVTSVTDDQVTLTVDRWYHGTATQRRADVVTLAVPGGTTSVALDGIQFTLGKRYLLTASDGTVNGCGFSGPADPRLEAAYKEAFGS